MPDRDDLFERLISAPSPETWESYDRQSDDARTAIVERLKSRLDALVQSEPKAALEAADVLMRAAERTPLLPLALRGKGVALHFNGRSEEALIDFAASAHEYESAGHDLDAARVRRSMVEVHQSCGQIDEALECAQRARGVLEEHGEERLLAQLDVNVGNAYLKRDEYPQASTHYEEGRALFASLDDRVGMAVCDFNLAVIRMNTNDTGRARSCWVAAHAEFSEIGMEVPVADCEYSLAYLESRQGRFESAIEGLEAARDRYRENGKPSGAPLCEIDLAEVFLRIDANDDALACSTRACESFDGLSMPYELARGETIRALARSRTGDTEGAAASLDRASRLYDEIGNEVGAAYLSILGFELDSQAPEEESLVELEDAARVVRERGLVLLENAATLALARAHVARGEVDRGRGIVEALLSPRDTPDPLDDLMHAAAWATLAETQRDQGDVVSAIASFERAIVCVDRVYSELPGRDIRLAFFRKNHEIFVALSWLLSRQENGAERALVVLERGRSRSLLQHEAVELSGDPEYREAREHLDWLLARRIDAEFGGSAVGHDLRVQAPDNDEIFATQRKLAHLSRARRGRKLGLSATFDEKDLARTAKPGEVVLAFLAHADSCRVFVVEDGRVDVVDLELEERRIRNLRDRLWMHVDRFLIRARDCRSEPTAASLALLDELGRVLLGRLIERIEGKRVVVVPFGALHDLPFHALRIDGSPLVDRCDVSYSLNLGALASRSASVRGHSSVLATCTWTEHLGAARQEVDALSSLFGSNCEELSPEKLIERLESGSARAGMMHVASHGIFQEQDPYFSALSLGARSLLAHDIARMTLDLDLATLSGCETGRRRRIGGEEPFGLAHAFLCAGTRAVLGSLWDVEDRATLEFMTSFYEELANGNPVRAAVCGAQRALARDGIHPFAWSAFSLIGDPDLCFEIGSATESS